MSKLHRLCFLLTSLLYFLSSSTVSAGSDPKSLGPFATTSIPSLSVESDTTAPSIPILIRPVDSSQTNDNTPEFVWNDSSDTGSNTILYTLYLNNVATYLGISNLGNSASFNYTSRLEANDIYLTPKLALPDGTYNWYIAASDLSNNTSHSTTWGVTIDTLAPALTLLDLDSYHNPTIIEGSNFDITGPKNVLLTVLSDPFASLQLTYTSPSTPTSYLTATANSAGLATFSQYLAPGIYTLTLLAIDSALNTTILPDFTLTLTQATLTLSLPGISTSYSIPYTPFSLSSLPATIAKIETRSLLPILLYILLAIVLLILPIILWYKRRYNLILFDSSLRPLSHLTIYHSNSHSHSPSSILHPPSSRLYIPRLSRFSTLTIRMQGDQLCTTYIMSISARQRLYTIILG